MALGGARAAQAAARHTTMRTQDSAVESGRYCVFARPATSERHTAHWKKPTIERNGASAWPHHMRGAWLESGGTHDSSDGQVTTCACCSKAGQGSRIASALGGESEGMPMNNHCTSTPDALATSCDSTPPDALKSAQAL